MHGSQCRRISPRGHRCQKLAGDHLEHHNIVTGDRWSDLTDLYGRPSTSPEPEPTPTSEVPVWEKVIEDMRDRDNAGRQKYGTPLQASNGRDSLIDAYQEALDLVVYLRQEIERRRDVKPCVEPLARVIYSAMRFERTTDTPAWVEGGNSRAQDFARKVARRYIQFGNEPEGSDDG